jgi:hypothetical protein
MDPSFLRPRCHVSFYADSLITDPPWKTMKPAFFWRRHPAADVLKLPENEGDTFKGHLRLLFIEGKCLLEVYGTLNPTDTNNSRPTTSHLYCRQDSRHGSPSAERYHQPAWSHTPRPSHTDRTSSFRRNFRSNHQCGSSCPSLVLSHNDRQRKRSHREGCYSSPQIESLRHGGWFPRRRPPTRRVQLVGASMRHV